MPIKIEDALSQWLINDYSKGAISKKRLYEEIYTLYRKREYKGEKITKIQISAPKTEQFHRYTQRLEIAGIIEPVNGKSFFHQDSKFYYVSSSKKVPEFSLLCSVYPYGYISHISAMQWYGITDRIPKIIYFTTYTKKEWRDRLRAEITERISSSLSTAEEFIPTYPNSGRHFTRDVQISVKKNPKMPNEVDEGIRIQDIGELFLDMFRSPEKCGGEQHVLDTFLEYAPSFKKKIIQYVDIFGTSIDKARMGFMLGSVIGVNSDKIEAWKYEKSNQRGGSRVLFPGRDFDRNYSSEWNLSINYSELHKYGTWN